MWKSRINNKILDMFSNLSDYISSNPSINTVLITPDVSQPLKSLAEHFDKYFLNDCIDTFDWVRSPFDIEMTDLSDREKEELAELSPDRSLKIQFQQKSL